MHTLIKTITHWRYYHTIKNDSVNRYGIPVSQMTTDMLHLSYRVTIVTNSAISHSFSLSILYCHKCTIRNKLYQLSISALYNNVMFSCLFFCQSMFVHFSLAIVMSVLEKLLDFERILTVTARVYKNICCFPHI
jgi:hypothetical protein